MHFVQNQADRKGNMAKLSLPLSLVHFQITILMLFD